MHCLFTLLSPCGAACIPPAYSDLKVPEAAACNVVNTALPSLPGNPKYLPAKSFSAVEPEDCRKLTGLSPAHIQLLSVSMEEYDGM